MALDNGVHLKGLIIVDEPLGDIDLTGLQDEDKAKQIKKEKNKVKTPPENEVTKHRLPS